MKKIASLVLTVLFLTPFVALHAADPAAKQPNILWLVAEDANVKWF